MALSDEQRAMLRLLEQREQGYDDIAALMGLSVEDVRAKVVGALAQLEAEGEPRPDVPPPFPAAGQAKTEIAAPAAPPSPKEPAEPLQSEEEPVPPKAKPAPPKPKSAAPGSTSAGGPSGGGGGSSSESGRTITIPGGNGIWPWIAAGVAVIAIVLAVILIAGSGGSSNSSTEAGTTPGSNIASEETAGEESEGEAEATGEEPKGVTKAVLKPVAGASATGGEATFGRIKNKLALQVVAEGLEPTGKSDGYTVWLAQSEQKMLPLASSAVKADGKIEAEFEVPTEVLAYLANGTFDLIYITHTQNAQLSASLKEAAKKKVAPAYTGDAVLKGTVTGAIVGAALREEEAKEAEEKGE